MGEDLPLIRVLGKPLIIRLINMPELLLWVLLSHGQHVLLEEGGAVRFQCPQITGLKSLNKTQGC